ncbi:MAG: peptidase inhibitor family I36 protein [Nostoc sp. SerVER01]|nr:peptidase inhibitor family I36 protein [Nostoc sp. SerVER01]
MKTTLKLKLVLGLTAGLVLSNWTISKIAKAQITDCPMNSVCVWSERNFTGERLVTTPTVTVNLGRPVCEFDSILLKRPKDVGLRRSVINNTACVISLYIQSQPQLSDGNISYVPSKNEVSTNNQQADSGEFRSIR